MENKTFGKTLAILLVCSAFIVTGINFYSEYQSRTNTLSYQRNYNFDIAIKNVGEPRTPTQYDLPIGIVEDNQGNKYRVYESRTIVTNDFSKLFIGGRT